MGELFHYELNSMSMSFYETQVEFQDTRGTHDLWSLTYEQFLNLENVFNLFAMEKHLFNGKVMEFNKKQRSLKNKAHKGKPDFEKFKRDQNNHPTRKSVVLDENGLAAFLFADFETDNETREIGKTFWKISILPFKKSADKKTGEDAIFPLAIKSVGNGVSRVLNGGFITALEKQFAIIKFKIAEFGLRNGQQAQNGKSVVKEKPIVIDTYDFGKNGEVPYTQKEILMRVVPHLKKFLATPEQILQTIVFKKYQQSVRNRQFGEHAKADAEARAKAEAEAEAKAKIEAEAKAKIEAEAEMRAKIEAEVKAKIEAEAKVKAEAEIKAAASRKRKEAGKAYISDQAIDDDEEVAKKRKRSATGKSTRTVITSDDDDDNNNDAKSDVTIFDSDTDVATESDMDFLDDEADSKDGNTHQHRSVDVKIAATSSPTTAPSSSMRSHGNGAKRLKETLNKIDAKKQSDADAAAGLSPPRSKSPSFLGDVGVKGRGIVRGASPPKTLNVVLDSPPRSPSPPPPCFDPSQKRNFSIDVFD